MKIAVLNAMVPYMYGGAEFLAEDLVGRLEEHGHKVELIRIPFAFATPGQVADCMIAARLMEVRENVDKLIALKFPVYYADHPDKSVWLIHQFRQAYDFEGTQFDLFASQEHEAQKIKKSIRQADTEYLSKVGDKLFTISQVVTDRLKQYNKIDSRVLYPPLMRSETYRCGEYGDYLYYPSRVNDSKRQKLAVEAMRYVKSGVRLVLSGKGDSEQDEEAVFKLIELYGVADKVEYINRFITHEEKLDLFADALGCLFLPDNEDYGYVTLEAFYAQKPVVTCTDSGCPAYFVEKGEAGHVVPPDAKALAEAMDKLYGDRKAAEELGKNGLPLVEKLDISWDNVIRSLV